MVLGYFFFRLKSYEGLKLFFYPLSALLNTKILDARGAAASYINFNEGIYS